MSRCISSRHAGPRSLRESPFGHTACASAQAPHQVHNAPKWVSLMYGCCVHTEVLVYHHDRRWVPTPNVHWHMGWYVIKAVRDALAHAVWPAGCGWTHDTALGNLDTDATQTRSSAQGNCSAKSLAGYVIDSSLSSLSSTNHTNRGGVQAGGLGWGRGRGSRPGGGQGKFHPPCHVLHYHMVLALKGLRTTNTRHVDQRMRPEASQQCERPPYRVTSRHVTSTPQNAIFYVGIQTALKHKFSVLVLAERHGSER